MTDFKFKVGDHVRKVGGSYQGTGVIKAAFRADDGTARYVFRFDNPPGLLHIFNEDQIEIFDRHFKIGIREGRIVVHDDLGEFLYIYPAKVFSGTAGPETHYVLKVRSSGCLPFELDIADQLVTAYAAAIALARKTWPEIVK